MYMCGEWLFRRLGVYRPNGPYHERCRWKTPERLYEVARQQKTDLEGATGLWYNSSLEMNQKTDHAILVLAWIWVNPVGSHRRDAEHGISD